MGTLGKRKTEQLQKIFDVYGARETLTSPEVIHLVADHGIADPTWLKGDNGTYHISPELWEQLGIRRNKPIGTAEVKSHLNHVHDLGDEKYATDAIHFDQSFDFYVPEIDPLFVPYGSFADIETIVQSGEFFPFWIAGHSGNGKTLSVEQACARHNRIFARVNITKTSCDEDYLFGGLRLVNGNTVPFYGPIPQAMILGAVCLLDETDLGDEKMMCLQPVLEGKPLVLKTLGKVVYPAAGFQICATANTKGKGSSDGRFIGTNVLNEAMLDRYVNFFDWNFPPPHIERSILGKALEYYGMFYDEDKRFANLLVDWSNQIRDNFDRQIINETISTRKLVHICRSYKMYNRDRVKAVSRCINRLAQETRTAFLDYYQALDASPDSQRSQQTPPDPSRPW